MKKKITKQLIGKKSRVSGARFELKVREDLENKGFILDKWTNNVDLAEGKLVKVKPKFVYNPKIKRMVMVGNSGGFPDFCIFTNKYVMMPSMTLLKPIKEGNLNLVFGVESKTNGILDKAEKEKCVWLIENKIFNRILIAKKIKVGRRVEVEYKEFKC